MSAPQNLNWIRDSLYMPHLPKSHDITFLGLYRRKPRGFSNGHYLQVNPQKFTHSKLARNNFVAFYFGGFLVFNSIFAYMQYQKGKWWWNPYTPQYFTQDMLKEYGFKV